MIEVINILLIIILIFVLIALFLKLYDLLRPSEAPFVSSPRHIYPQIFRFMKIQPNDRVYDLGCGNAEFLVYCSQLQPKATYLGVERGAIPFLLSKISTRSYKNIKIIYGDINKFRIPKGSKIYAYLSPKSIDKIMKKAPENSILYSLNFKSSKVSPTSIIKLKNSTSISRKLYIYKK